MADETVDVAQADTAQADTAQADTAQLEARVAELEDRWRRALADLDNLRKRVARDAAQVTLTARARAAAEWLPVLDGLDLALEHAGSAPGSFVDGVRAVRDQALAVMERLGFPRRDDVGRPFDPALQEAVATVPDPLVQASTVVHVVRPAYGEGERQLRPASVVVATRVP
ncbi:MAG TPA: nucleotide exchange factor GrpE [Kineosporiaceae bacterium]